MRVLGRFAAISVLAAIAGGYAMPSIADDKAKFAIDKVTCRDVLKMDGEERAYTFVFFHGYVSGKRNTVAFDADALSTATDKVEDFCIDNPKELLLVAFEKSRG